MKTNQSAQLTESSTANVIVPGQDFERARVSKERKYTAAVLAAIAIFTFADLIEDRMDGAPWSHVLGELAVVIVATVLASTLYRRSHIPLLQRSRLLERELTQAQVNVTHWQEEAQQLSAGLSTAIFRQLDEWNLSEAEKDIALLLLKGLSHKEIAIARKTSEQTVRQQAASLYQKSNLAGRSELAAFFLEDLLVRPQPKDE